jgi:beta-lactamase regulating signal transducer with metallopeptidase domain
MTFYESLVEWSGRVWPLFANHLWQATLFFLFVLVVSASLKRAPARVHYSLWLVALAKFVLPSSAVAWLTRQAGIDFGSLLASSAGDPTSVAPITPFLSPVTSSPTIHYTVLPAPTVTGQDAPAYIATVEQHSYWYAALTLIWIAGCVLFLCLWLKRRRALSAVVRAGRVVTSGREFDALGRVQSWLGMRRKVTLVSSPELTQPGVWRAFRPILVLPEGMAGRLDDDELEAVMMHELIHVERWDNLVSVPQRIVCCLMWFHPLVWLMDSRLLAEREQACDDAVIRLNGDSQVYASSIKKVCRHSLGWEFNGLSSAAGSDLKRRIRRIASAGTNRNTSVLHRAVLGVVATALICLSGAAAMINNSESVDRASDQAGVAVDGRFVAPASHEARKADAAEVVKKEPSNLPPPPPPSAATAAQPVKRTPAAIVEVREDLDRIEPGEPGIAARAVEPRAADVRPDFLKEPSPVMAALHSIFVPAAATTNRTESDLSRFVGRYEVDPTRSENFILDITLEYGDLWLKPSHAAKRKLLLKGETVLSDVHSDFQFTAMMDNRGRVTGLRLDSWSSDITARKLSLPQPSTSGATTFRLRGHPNARIVALAGSFNNWNQSQLLFAREGDEWVCRVNLPRGKHQYKFVVDGDWLTDPGNPKIVHDERGNLNSQLSAE